MNHHEQQAAPYISIVYESLLYLYTSISQPTRLHQQQNRSFIIHFRLKTIPCEIVSQIIIQLESSKQSLLSEGLLKLHTLSSTCFNFLFFTFLCFFSQCTILTYKIEQIFVLMSMLAYCQADKKIVQVIINFQKPIKLDCVSLFSTASVLLILYIQPFA